MWQSSYTHICPGFPHNPANPMLRNKTTSLPMTKAGLSTWRPNATQRSDLPDAACNLKDIIALSFWEIVSLSTDVTRPKRLVQKGAGLERRVKSHIYNDVGTVRDELITLSCVLMSRRVSVVLSTVCKR